MERRCPNDCRHRPWNAGSLRPGVPPNDTAGGAENAVRGSGGGVVKLTIQPGINAHDLAQAIYQTIQAGAECDALARRRLHEARVELARKSGGTVAVPDTAEQGKLF